MRDGKAMATFRVNEMPGTHPVQVLGENRKIVAKDGVFTDAFGPWDVHLYRLAAGGSR